MNICQVEHNMHTTSLDIYISGCKGHCKQCHNPETWDFELGTDSKEVYSNRIAPKMQTLKGMITRIMIYGGEPLDQDHDELYGFLYMLEYFKLPIWLFTSYDITDIPERLLEYVDYVKCGRYIPALVTDSVEYYGIKLATANQYILKL